MKPFRNRDGLTLVELLVTIAIGSIVTLAATTVLLLGLRINRQSTDTVTHQNTTRIILSTLEDMASEAQIKKLITGPDSWYICSTDTEMPETGNTIVDTVLIGFDAKVNKICTGGTVTTTITTTTEGEGNEAKDIQAITYAYTDGTAMLEGVYTSHAILDDNNLLTFAVQTEEGNYTTSVYCRMAPESVDTDPERKETIDQTINKMEENTENGETTKARAEFLKVATSQLGSPGVILEKITTTNEEDEEDTNVAYISAGQYYSHWYNGGFTNGWNEDTPWCAVFVHWALDADRWKVSTDEPVLLKKPLDCHGKGLANVDNFIDYLSANVDNDAVAWYPCELTTKTINNKTETVSAVKGKNYQIIPGDLIFFDWTVDDVYDADHVGIVLAVNGGYIYTIEGNSADMVAVRRYAKDDPRIMGYGVLNWKTNSELGAN